MEKLPIKSYKPREVAEMLGCTTMNVYKLIKYGQLYAFRVGSRKVNMRIPDYAVQDFIDKMNARNKAMQDG